MVHQPIRILLVEDNPGDARLLREMLAGAPSSRFELTSVGRLDQAFPRFVQEHWDVVLLDLSLPDGQGLDTFARVHAQAQHLPIIVMTGLDDETLAVEAVRKGAQDYLVKGQVDKNLLVRAIRYAIERKRVEAERTRAEELIKTSLREKEVLLQEIHHRVKNNLQIISSLLSLQSSYIRDPQASAIFQDSQNRVRSMALIHEKLYQSENLARINFGEYVHNLVTFLFRSYKSDSSVIALKIQADGIYLDVDSAVPCGLIVNELVSNALKHAFAPGQAGEIRIQLFQDVPDQYRLEISDNGVGIPSDMDFRHTESLGLRLVSTLVDQLDGHIELDRRRGTAFKVTFIAL
jgi:two-component sensor histidine kinase/CheY-like chemotaxis protein